MMQGVRAQSFQSFRLSAYIYIHTPIFIYIYIIYIYIYNIHTSIYIYTHTHICKSVCVFSFPMACVHV